LVYLYSTIYATLFGGLELPHADMQTWLTFTHIFAIFSTTVQRLTLQQAHSSKIY